jgi:transitional endoplasmic reticulum ATPase
MPSSEERLAAVRAALDINPGNNPLRLYLAHLLLQNERPEEARQEFQTVLSRLRSAIIQRPADADLYRLMADAQQGLGDEAGALASFGISVALQPVANQARDQEPEQLPDDEAPDQEVESADSREARDNQFGHASSPGRLRMGHDDDSEDTELDKDQVERPTIKFADVGGLEDVKERIRMAIVYPFQHPEMFAAYGKRAGGGLLLFGPPGCGKTYIARATAGEVGAAFINVGISDVLDMWHGQSEQKLHVIFETARRLRPTVLFFDEIEALGGNRLDMRQHFQRTLVNQFLAEMDGMEGDNSEILIIGATNSPWHVEPALRRPGRFEHIVFVPPPDEDARREILRLHLAGKPAAEDVEISRIAGDTESFSGADLRALVDTASDEALKNAMRSGKVVPFSTNLLLQALRKTRPSTLDWLNTARNYAIYSNQGGLYDDVVAYLKKHKLMR